MEFVHMSEIELNDRQRKAISEADLLTLTNDIARIGLLHPIVLRNEDTCLVAGERRFRAMTNLHRTGRRFTCDGKPVPPNMIPCTRLTDRTEVDYYEAELYENLSRVDLSWADQTEALAQLHNLRREQTQGQQTFAATAKEVDTNITRVSDDVRLYEHFNDPEVANAKTKKDALKILDRKLNEQRNAKLAEQWKGAAQSGCPHTLLQGDMAQILPSLPDKAFDVILTDPPYGIGANKFGDQASLSHTYNDDWNAAQALFQTLAAQSYRIAKPKAHAYVFCDISIFYQLMVMFQTQNWNCWPRPLIWYKGNQGTLPRPNHGPRYTYEAILFCSKGDKPVEKLGAHDVIQVQNTEKSIHAAEKPVELYQNLLTRSVRPGNAVIDPFCGSGTIFPAATSLHLTATGIELEQRMYNYALSRMEEKYD